MRFVSPFSGHGVQLPDKIQWQLGLLQRNTCKLKVIQQFNQSVHIHTREQLQTAELIETVF